MSEPALDLPPLRDPERVLALAYVPAPRRSAVHALWALDEALGTLVAQAREPALGQIRLAWWREALIALDGGPPPVDPLLRSLDALVVPVTGGAALAPIAEGWGALLGDPDDEALTAHARDRGGTLFAVAARLLGEPDFADAARAGRVWALADIHGHGSAELRTHALALAAAELGAGQGDRWPKRLRPLGMLAALAAHDVRSGRPAGTPGSPMRIIRMMVHRLTGTSALGVGRGES